MFELTQRNAPQRFVIAQPGVHRAKRFGVQLADTGGTAFTGDHEAGRTQQSQVLRDRWPALTEVRGQIADAAPSVAQQSKDLAPRGIGDGPKDDVPTGG